MHSSPLNSVRKSSIIYNSDQQLIYIVSLNRMTIWMRFSHIMSGIVEPKIFSVNSRQQVNKNRMSFKVTKPKMRWKEVWEVLNISFKSWWMACYSLKGILSKIWPSILNNVSKHVCVIYVLPITSKTLWQLIRTKINWVRKLSQINQWGLKMVKLFSGWVVQ